MGQHLRQRWRKKLGKIGCLCLTVGLAGCGQGILSLGQPSRLADATGLTPENLSPENVTPRSSGATLVAADFDESAYSADAIGTELERMRFRTCHTTESQTIDGTLYFLCTGINGQPLQAEMGALDGRSVFRYWFRDDGSFYAQESDVEGELTRSVVAEDGKTVILTNAQGELAVVEDVRQWQALTDMAEMAAMAVSAELERGRDLASTQTSPLDTNNQPVGIVRLARTGGDFNHRWATLVVPQPSTAVSAEGGAMRWYDLHLATMVAITADQFCGNPSARGAYFNYEADGGRVYMGRYFIPCNTAKEMMATFGQNRYAWVVWEEGGLGGEAVDQWVPALSDAMMPQFRRQVVEVLTPECSDAGFCPGDRI